MRPGAPTASDAVDLPRLGVTLGDPRGIGPEVTSAAIARSADLARFTLFGPTGVMDPAGHRFESVGEWAAGVGRSGADPEEAEAAAGGLAGSAIRAAVDAARAGTIDALVTAPIDKHALHLGGFDHPGHTEMLATLTGVPAVAMMMAAEETALGGALRVVLATTHVALRAVPSAIDSDLLVTQARLAADGLRRGWGIGSPRLALCALNPHASDGGLFGDEEARVFAPAVRRLTDAGLDVSGPIPADTVFVRALRGEFDAVVAPYHDVGMAAFKTASFGRGVNVTLGLPFPRTSPDHGTALDIAGKGVADPTSMCEAIGLAARLVVRGREVGGDADDPVR